MLILGDTGEYRRGDFSMEDAEMSVTSVTKENITDVGRIVGENRPVMYQQEESLDLRLCYRWLIQSPIENQKTRKGSKATVLTKNVFYAYSSALNVLKRQRWISKFKPNNFDLSDSYRSGRPITLDSDMLRAEVEKFSATVIL